PGFSSPGVQPATINPIYELYDDNIRCGRGAAMTGHGVETLAVSAGNKIGFVPTQTVDGKDRDVPFYHPGFAQAYLSRAPADLESYTGDGDWFKVAYMGAKNDTEWAILGHTMANFTLPKTTPPGKYLLRLEVIFGITHEFNVTQFYVNCAHIEVNGPGGGKTSRAIGLAGLIFAQESLAQWLNSRVRTTSGITVRLTTEN
ncbi:uncharacterized protein BDR25DRAFT_369847, partial [Lindgomyces ingoldianus]